MNRPHALKEVILFFALVFGATYLVFWGPLALFQVRAISWDTSQPAGPTWAIALFFAGGFVPSAAGLLLTFIDEGRPGVKRLLRRVAQVRIGWRWHLAAAGTAAAASVGQIALLNLLGQPFDWSLFLAQAWMLALLFFIGPFSEELGWAGYATDRLQARLSPPAAGLALGLLWSGWHLPLFYIPGVFNHEVAWPFASFLLQTTAMRLVYLWLHNRTSGSIWTAIFFHWLHTWANTVVVSAGVQSAQFLALLWIPYALIALLAAALLLPRRVARTAGAHT